MAPTEPSIEIDPVGAVVPTDDATHQGCGGDVATMGDDRVDKCAGNSVPPHLGINGEESKLQLVALADLGMRRSDIKTIAKRSVDRKVGS